jgi:hypothetical protein
MVTAPSFERMDSMPKEKRASRRPCPEEFRERAVRMVLDHQDGIRRNGRRFSKRIDDGIPELRLRLEVTNRLQELYDCHLGHHPLV